MFEKMRRFRQALSFEECSEVLRQGTSGVLAVYDGQTPYAVPLSYVWDGEKIFFHCAKAGHKLDAIAHNDSVSFCVIGLDDVHGAEYTTYFRSVIVFGKVRVLTDDGERRRALELLSQRYRPGFEEEMHAAIERDLARVCVVEISAEHISGKQSVRLIRPGD